MKNEWDNFTNMIIGAAVGAVVGLAVCELLGIFQRLHHALFGRSKNYPNA